MVWPVLCPCIDMIAIITELLPRFFSCGLTAVQMNNDSFIAISSMIMIMIMMMGVVRGDT